MGLILCVIAIASTAFVTGHWRRHGLGILLFWGYAYGILRANVYDTFSHFIFDAALFAYYVVVAGDILISKKPLTPLDRWVIALMAWPALLLPFGRDGLFVQLVGLRFAIYFLPCLIVGARTTANDWRTFGYWLVGLNAVALTVGLAEYVYGVDKFIPDNGASFLVYRSAISADRYRIPSTFCHAHSYGAAMLLSIPVLVWLFVLRESPLKRFLAAGGISAALAGVLLSSTRSSVAILVVGTAISLILMGNSALRRLLPLVAVAGLVVYLVVGSMDEEAQRFRDLGEVEVVVDRFDTPQRALERVTEALSKYPMGNGLTGAQGISIPYFLAEDTDQERDIITGESEFVRLAGTQGTVGLLLFAAFLVWFFFKGPGPDLLARLAYGFCFAVCLSCYAGVGAFTGVPGGPMVLLLMGWVRHDALTRTPQRVPANFRRSVKPVPARLPQIDSHV
jgi:hypothetical protein